MLGLRWVARVAPWRWRPILILTEDPWYWSLGVEPYIDWAPGYHFDGFGVWLKFGPWVANLCIRDNN